ncbi:MAG: hypothetical protein GX163_03720 [Bacteroidetes bacterium]|jgi:hypothetical protein|nr:hypothetical protein [Bacteroidota bacterium]
MMKLNIRIENLEVRSSEDSAEILVWIQVEPNEYANVLAYWIKESEGYCLKFVGGSPFDYPSRVKDFWFLAELGQSFLNLKFNNSQD